MNPALQIRTSPDGRIQARRLDGKPLSDSDRQEARRIAESEGLRPSFTPLTPEQAAEIDSGKVRAVLIDSEILGAPFWFAFDESFDPADGIPVFYPDELQFLKDKPAATLRKIYETKRAFGLGTRVRQ
jgi:hypothetical protein